MTLFPKLNNLNKTSKICLTGLLIALDILCQKIFAINYLPFAPFLRISFAGPCLIIFASLFLGPLYGLLVGASSDLLGYLVFDPKAYPLFFQITLIYALLGFISYYVFAFVKHIKNQRLTGFLFIGFLFILLTLVCVFLFTNNDITLFSTTYHLVLYQKIVSLIVLVSLSISLFVFILIYHKKAYDPKSENFTPLQTGFACLLIELFVMVIFGSLMKAWAFGFNTYLVIVLTQIMVLFINVPLNTVLLTVLFKTAFAKFTKKNGVE